MGQDCKVGFSARGRQHRGSAPLLVARENFKFVISTGQQIQNWKSHSDHCVFT